MEYNPRVLTGRLKSEFEMIGVDPAGIDIMLPKSEFRAVKLKKVPSTAANIIKQEMLSEGGDAATARGTINHGVSETDIIIFGTKRQFRGLIDSIRHQHFKLSVIAKEIEDVLKRYELTPSPILGMEFGKRTYVMGILNVTPDSFFENGKYFDTDRAVKHAVQMVNEGADIIDIGGESTRPGSHAVTAAEEIKRIIPVIEGIVKTVNTVISVDTQKATVAQEAIKAGAKIINDISALNYDQNMANIAAKFDVPIILMHMQGSPADMQFDPHYDDLISEILDYLEKSVTIALKAGVKENKIIVDPGIGFGKTFDHNIEILRRLNEFKSLGKPLLLGASNKSFIGKVIDAAADQRLEGTIAAVVSAIGAGADIVRVHNVLSVVKAVKMADAAYR